MPGGKRKPAPPPPNVSPTHDDQPPDTVAPPPPGDLRHVGSLASQHSHGSSQHSHGSTVSLPSVGSLGTLDPKFDYRNFPYYYTNFTNQEEVCQYLSHHSKKTAGFFLLRPSFRNKNNLTVSVVVSDKTVRHTNIMVEMDRGLKQYYLVKEKKFTSVYDLMNHYREHDVKNLQKVSNVRFLYPLNRARARSESDTSSTSSHYQSAHKVSPEAAPENLPPALPVRPSNLPRLNSQKSLGSTSSFSMSPSPSGAVLTSSPQNGNIGGSHQSLSSSPSAGMISNRFPSQSSINSIVDSRPPAPLPLSHSSKDPNPYYSSPRNVDEDITDRLKEVLRQSERCDCGIPRDMSDLPMGWTVHRSKDPATYNRIFYQNNRGLTSWKLPPEVQSKMNIVQQTNLEQLLAISRQQLSLPRTYSGNTERSSGSRDPRSNFSDFSVNGYPDIDDTKF